MRQISEADWKYYRQLHPIVLERFCQRVLSEVEKLASAPEKTAHERYVVVFQRLKLRDRELAQMFDDMRRSIALTQLAIMLRRELLTEEELGRLSAQTREFLQGHLDLE